jgi:hypothetical protein
MISSMVWGHQNRLRALELMAEAFELPGVTLARSTTA